MRRSPLNMPQGTREGTSHVGSRREAFTADEALHVAGAVVWLPPLCGLEQ